MDFKIIFTKIDNNVNLKIFIKYLKNNFKIVNFLFHYFKNIFLLKYFTFIYKF